MSSDFSLLGGRLGGALKVFVAKAALAADEGATTLGAVPEEAGGMTETEVLATVVAKEATTQLAGTEEAAEVLATVVAEEARIQVAGPEEAVGAAETLDAMVFGLGLDISENEKSVRPNFS